MMILVSCGVDTGENQTETLNEKEDKSGMNDGETERGEISDNICRDILEYDFSVQEYPIDTSLFTADVEAEFLEAFYEVLTNRIPLWYQDSTARFFRDYLRGVAYLSDREFVDREVKNTLYRLIDMDGDGLPELAMEVDWGICILKYNMEEQRVTKYFGPSEGWKLLGSNRFGLHDTGSPCLSQNRYIVWDEQRETVQEFNFQADSMYEIKCTVSGSGEINGGAAVSEEEWDILTEDFFSAMADPIQFVTYEEVFGDVADHLVGREDSEEVRQVYREFLAGERSAENATIDAIPGITDLKGEIRKEKYLIDDMTGDNVPELVIRADGRYDILTYRSGRLFVLCTLSADDYVLLEGGQVLYRSIQEDHEFYMCYQMQPSGTLYAGERFLRTDMNGDGIYDEKDQYEYDNSDPFYRAGGGDTMQTVTMEEWLEKIAEYLYVDENGRMQTIRELSLF